MPEPLRILHVVGDSKYGGGSVVVQRLAEFARRQGFDVDVLTTDRIFQGILRGNGIEVVDLPCIWRDTRLRDAVGLWRLVTFLQKNRYTIVHTHTSKGGFIGRLAARLAHVPVVIHTVHGFAFHEQSKPYQILLFGTLERLAAKWCDAIVTVSEFHRNWALRLGIGTPQQVFAIPNGIPPNRVYPTQPRDITRAELGVGEGEYLLISIGRLAPQKGFEYALSALQLLRPSQGQAIRLVIAGEGPMRSALENMIRRMSLETSVSLIGFREDVGNLLAAADVVILPSLWEGLSISLLEAMAAGKPIITTDIGSNREVLAQEQAALLVPAADAAALANAIARLMRDPGLANELGRRAREVYERHYTEDRMLRQYHEVYAMLVRRKLGYSGLLTVDEATTRRKGDAGLPDSFALGRCVENYWEACRVSKPSLVIVTNGNYFARLIVGPTLLSSQWKVSGIVIVSGDYYGRTKWRAFFDLARKTAFPYLGYKLFSILLFEIMDLTHKGEFKVASFADRLGIPVLVSCRVNDPNVIRWVSELNPSLLVSVSCPQRIGKSLLSACKVAALNIHSSLLPSYAGLAPYFWVLANDEKQTGITVHYMTEKFDEGNILSQAVLDILPEESAFSLFKRLSCEGGRVLRQGIEQALKGEPGIPQDPSKRSYFSHPSWRAYIRLKRNNHSLITIQDLIGIATSNRRLASTERGPETDA